jgi:hypothetical protein
LCTPAEIIRATQADSFLSARIIVATVGEMDMEY